MFKRLLCLCCLSIRLVQGQEDDSLTLAQQTDVRDLFRKVFKVNPPPDKPQPNNAAILPSLGYNPSMGFIVGANLTGGRYLGPATNTMFSTVLLGAQVTSKGIITAQLRHNVFTTGNKWNLQGNVQVSRMVLLDYGLGTGNGSRSSDAFSIIGYSLKNTAALFPVKFSYIRLTQKAYRHIGGPWFAGGGLSLDVRFNVQDERLDEGETTPQYQYSMDKGMNWKKNSANGLLFHLQFNNREHPNRAYGGWYGDVGIRLNQRWLASTKNAVQLNTEVRKYWSLSQQKPEKVIAIWHWGSYLMGGTLPYFELPATATDTYNRSGRAYTIGRFRGPSFFYFETEYRFPITRNKLISGVAFTNWQSASNADNKNLFQSFEPGAGMGFRFLFNKNSRTNLCLDFAAGRYGASGIFMGLNEAF